jgi:hypothetical protein
MTPLGIPKDRSADSYVQSQGQGDLQPCLGSGYAQPRDFAYARIHVSRAEEHGEIFAVEEVDED